MQKILELTSQDWMRGLSISGHMPSSGLFSEASGINPFSDPYSTSYQTGLLQTSAAPSEIQGVVVDDEIIDIAYLGSAYTAYLSGNDGNLYTMDTSSYGTPTEIKTGITNITDGLELFKAGGTTFLLVWQQGQIGSYNTSTTAWSPGAFTATTTAITHPTHQFLGSIYYGDANYISRMYDNSGTIAESSQELDLPTSLVVNTIDDDGYYLVFGATSNTNSGNLQVNTLNKIFFWDTYSSSWNKEYTLPVAGIHSIKRVGEMMYALTTDGLYAFNFSVKPYLLFPLSNSDTGPGTPGDVPTNRLAAAKNNVFYWLTGDGDISAYGSPIPGLSPRFYRPYKAVSTVGTYLGLPDKYQIITAGATGKLGTINSASTGNTGLAAETIYIPLGKKYDIKRIEIITGEPLASGDELNIDVQSDEDTSASDYGTFSFATHGAKRSHLLTGGYHAENLKIIINFVAGNVKVKKITVYGEPVAIS